MHVLIAGAGLAGLAAGWMVGEPAALAPGFPVGSLREPFDRRALLARIAVMAAA